MLYTLYFSNNKPNLNNILSNVYNSDKQNIKILKLDTAYRLHIIINYLKKNNIKLSIPIIIYICEQIQKNNNKFDMAYYEHLIKNEFNTIRNKTLLYKFSYFSSIFIILYIDVIKKIELLKKYKKYIYYIFFDGINIYLFILLYL
jgi:hypothetical protein